MIKPIKKHWIVSFIIIALIILLFNFWNVMTDYLLYKNKIGVNLPKNSIVLSKNDSHGGFHDDGEYYSEIQLTESGLKEFIKNADKSGSWKACPLPEDIEILIHDVGNMSKSIPKNIENGIYYVRDKFAEEYPMEKNKNILNRSSYNVTVSILNIDTKKLYIYELDT